MKYEHEYAEYFNLHFMRSLTLNFLSCETCERAGITFSAVGGLY